MVFLIAVLAGIGGIWLFVQFMRVIAQGLILCIIGVAICLRAVWRGGVWTTRALWQATHKTPAHQYDVGLPETTIVQIPHYLPHR